MLRAISMTIAAALLAQTSFAQNPVPVRQAVTPQHAGTFKLATKEFIPASGQSRLGPDVIYNNTIFSNYYAVPQPGQEWIDQGALQDRNGDLFDQINGFDFAYCSSEPDPTQNSGVITISFYRETIPCQLPNEVGGLPDGPDCTYEIFNLPLGDPGGNVQCWIVTVDLAGGFECSSDQDFMFPTEDATDFNRLFGWSIMPQQDNTGPILSNGGYRVEDNFVWWDTFNQVQQGCFNFGGQPLAGFGLRLYGPPPGIMHYWPSEPGVNDTLVFENTPIFPGLPATFEVLNPNPGMWYWLLATEDWNQIDALGGTLLVDYPNLLPPTPLSMGNAGILTVPIPPVIPPELHFQSVETNSPVLNPTTVTAFSSSTKHRKWQPSTEKCSVTSFDVPKNKSACKVVDAGGGRKKVGQDFEMDATFGDPNAKCCEYRQYVKGEFKVNGTVLSHGLPGGKKLEKNKYHEDGVTSPSATVNEHYGHRDEGDMDTTDVYSNPDRKTGKNYDGYDFPGIAGTPPFNYSIDLTFKGEIIDVCNCNKVVKSTTWSVKCSGSVSAPEIPVVKEEEIRLVLDNQSAYLRFTTYEDQRMTTVVSIPNGDGRNLIDANEVSLVIDSMLPTEVPQGSLIQTELRGATAHAIYTYAWPSSLHGTVVSGTLSVRGSQPTPFSVQL